MILKKISVALSSLALLGCGASSAPQKSVSTQEYYKPKAGVSWQWQLLDKVDTSYDVELYDIDLEDSSKALIEALHVKNKKVICYFSAGSFEDFRADKKSFDEAIIGDTLDGWPDERWLDIRADSLKGIMKKRLDLAKEKGCDGVEADNVDGFENPTGFKLTAQDQLNYNIFLAKEAHNRGLSIGLKNDVSQIKKLEPYFDFAVNEECYVYNECEALTPFIQNNKAVLHVEYLDKFVDNVDGSFSAMCSSKSTLKFSSLVLPLELNNAFRLACEK